MKAHEVLLAELTGQLVPQLVAAFGIGADTAAELLIVAGDNIDRVRSGRNRPSGGLYPRMWHQRQAPPAYQLDGDREDSDASLTLW
ncbi:hypothetical protein [Geodermatophilus sp. URMC 63]